jgi:hypothetical protein
VLQNSPKHVFSISGNSPMCLVEIVEHVEDTSTVREIVEHVEDTSTVQEVLST